MTANPSAAAKAIIGEIGTDRARDLAGALLVAPRSSSDDRYSQKFLGEVAKLVERKRK